MLKSVTLIAYMFKTFQTTMVIDFSLHSTLFSGISMNLKFNPIKFMIKVTICIITSFKSFNVITFTKNELFQ